MMLALIAIWALAEATLFFIVADVPIMALAIRAGVKKALIGALVGAVFAAHGGAIIFYLTTLAGDEVWRAMLMVPGVDIALMERVLTDWLTGGPMAMVIGSFTGVPYKLYAFAAAWNGASMSWLPTFVFLSILARLPRFALVALVAGWAGPRLVQRFGARIVWTGFALGWTGFYALYWSMMGF